MASMMEFDRPSNNEVERKIWPWDKNLEISGGFIERLTI